MNAYEETRNTELLHMDMLIKLNLNTTNQLRANLQLQGDLWVWIRETADEHEYSYYNVLNFHADSAERFAMNLNILREAMHSNNREIETGLYYRLLLDMYNDLIESYDWRGFWPPYSMGPLTDGFFIDFDEWDALNQANIDFVRYTIDNKIYYLYANEMKGFNFIYQAMLQLLPYVLLVFVFLGVCDVFTRENETGSYKTLLLQPFSRLKIYSVKLLSSYAIALLLIFVPLIIMFLILGFINGFGSYNYPVIVHPDSYFTLTPIENNLFINDRRGFLFYDSAYFGSMRRFTDFRFGFMHENASLGISSFSPMAVATRGAPDPDSPYYAIWRILQAREANRMYTSAFIPYLALSFTGMLSVILMSLPLYFLLILLAVSVSAFIGVLTQNSAVSLVLSTLVGYIALLYPNPIHDFSFWERLNPFVYTNPINILNGLGSTTALTGILVLLGFTLCFVVIGIFVFSRRDIRC
jgi:ABC-type transport system involved in multi-copper enzyme maturation permease subunit